MRTVVLVGLLYIGDAIGKPGYSDASVMIVIAVIFVAAIVMDVVEFFKRSE